MKRIGRKNRISRLPAVALAVILLWAATGGASARADCWPAYIRCVENASDLQSSLGRSIAGLFCFADLLSCLQRRLA